MEVIDLLVGLLAVGLVFYLAVAMLFPEKF